MMDAESQAAVVELQRRTSHRVLMRMLEVHLERPDMTPEELLKEAYARIMDDAGVPR